MFCTIGLLWSIPHDFLPGATGDASWAPFVNFGSILVLGSLVFYFRMGLTIGLGMLLWSALALWGNWRLDLDGGQPLWLISAVTFVIAWIGQFVGHKIEGVKPSFLEDIQFLLVGPAWLLHFVYRRLGVPM